MPSKIIIVTPNYANYGFLGKWSHCKSAKNFFVCTVFTCLIGQFGINYPSAFLEILKLY